VPLVYPLFKNNAQKTFRFNGKNYHYFDHSYNNAWKNERTVEVPLAFELLKKYKGKSILEVGNVLNHYKKGTYDVVDKYEEAPHVINEDIVDYKPKKKYDLILCLSTLEHVGWDEEPKDPTKTIQAVLGMKKLLAKGGLLFVTIPCGYNPPLDVLVLKKKIPFTQTYYLTRTTLLNEWRQVDEKDIPTMNYGIVIMSAKTLCVGVIQA
jgi:hypothetical protein